MTRAVILCLAVAMAGAAPGPGGPGTARPATRPTTDEALLPEDRPRPVIPPVTVEAVGARRARALIPQGAVVLDRVARLAKSGDGKWWTIPDPRVGSLRLLPCRLLEAVERIHASVPKRRFRFSGEVCRYRRQYYLLLRQVEELIPAPATQPARRTPPPAPATGTPA